MTVVYTATAPDGSTIGYQDRKRWAWILSLVVPLPVHYRDKIRGLDGVRSVASANWLTRSCVICIQGE